MFCELLFFSFTEQITGKKSVSQNLQQVPCFIILLLSYSTKNNIWQAKIKTNIVARMDKILTIIFFHLIPQSPYLLDILSHS